MDEWKPKAQPELPTSEGAPQRRDVWSVHQGAYAFEPVIAQNVTPPGFNPNPQPPAGSTPSNSWQPGQGYTPPQGGIHYGPGGVGAGPIDGGAGPYGQQQQQAPPQQQAPQAGNTPPSAENVWNLYQQYQGGDQSAWGALQNMGLNRRDLFVLGQGQEAFSEYWPNQSRPQAGYNRPQYDVDWSNVPPGAVPVSGMRIGIRGIGAAMQSDDWEWEEQRRRFYDTTPPTGGPTTDTAGTQWGWGQAWR